MATKPTKGPHPTRGARTEEPVEADGPAGWSLRLPSGVIFPGQVKFVGEDGVTITFSTEGQLTHRRLRSTDGDTGFFIQPLSDFRARQTPAEERQLVKTNSDDGEDQAQASVVRRAEEVIGDRSDAMRWLGTPVRALNYATPISLLHDAQGREQVLTVLGRLEHGVL